MVDKVYGTLELVSKEKVRFWKISGPQPVMMVRRIIPASGNDENNCALIQDNKNNVEHIQWLMTRYPLDILSGNDWVSSINDLNKLKQRMENIRTLEDINPKGTFKGTLLDFQKKGLDFLMKTYGNCLLADEMGLGKTIQSLAYLSTDEDTMPCLVVSPLVTLRNWKNEIGNFMSVKSTRGLFKGRELSPMVELIRSGKPAQLGHADFYIINYELLQKRSDDLAKVGLRTVIFDEAQHLRNKDTGKYKGAREVSQFPTVKHRLGLSGTPIYNRGSEVWPITDIIQQGILGTYNEFVDTYCYIDHRNRAIVKPEMRDAVADRLRETIMLRRKKKDVLKDLKDKVIYKEIIETDSDLYEREMEKMLFELEEKRRNSKTQFTKIHMYEEASRNERKIAGMAKLPYVIKFVKDMMDLDESIVVFCHHRSIHESLHTHLAEYYPSSIIGGQNDDVRQWNIDKFVQGKTKLMIAGLRAGNVGINLTNASYVIHAELDWTPAIHRQAEDRLHRIGQTETVFSYYLVGSGTMDDKIADVLVDKAQEIDAIVGDKTEEIDESRGEALMKSIQERLGRKEGKLITDGDDQTSLNTNDDMENEIDSNVIGQQTLM